MQPETLFDILTCVALTLLAGLMSGLTLGLLSMDSVDLEVLRRSGTEQEKKHAARIEPVLKRPHLLLVTLLLTNAAAMEALPLFLDKLVSPTLAVIISVTAVLFFGEIIPQAVCTRYGLAIGAYASWFVRLLMGLEFVIAYPISLVLDWTLGKEHGALFRRAQLKALVDIHGSTEGMGGYLNEEEVNVIRGALDLTGKQAMVAMTPLEKVFMLPADAELNLENLKKILASGHSRIPVHRPGNRKEILGLVLVKELVLVDLNSGTRISDVKLRGLPTLRGDTAAYDLLKLFQTGRSHMVVLTQPPPRLRSEAGEVDNGHSAEAASRRSSLEAVAHSEHTVVDMDPPPVPYNGCAPSTSASCNLDERVPIGIVTIEDVIEELIGTEIIDETDMFVDNLRLQKVNAAVMVKNLPPRLRSLLMARGQPAAETRNSGGHLLPTASRAASPNRATPRQLRRSKTEDGRRMDIPPPDVQRPLLDQNGHDGSPRSL